MEYDIRITAAQLVAAARWVEPFVADDFDDVSLLADDRMLLVAQGDERAAFDTDGSDGSDEYVAVAPLDR